jgi:hypothetical protein
MLEAVALCSSVSSGSQVAASLRSADRDRARTTDCAKKGGVEAGECGDAVAGTKLVLQVELNEKSAACSAPTEVARRVVAL